MGVYIAGKQVSNSVNNYAVKRDAIRRYPNLYNEETFAPGQETGYQYLVISSSSTAASTKYVFTINLSTTKLYSDETCFNEINEQITDINELSIRNAKAYYNLTGTTEITYALPVSEQSVVSYTFELSETQIKLNLIVNRQSNATVLCCGISGILMYKNYIIAGTDNGYVSSDAGSSATDSQKFYVSSYDPSQQPISMLSPTALEFNKGPNIKKTLQTGDVLSISTEAVSETNIAYIRFMFSPYTKGSRIFSVKDLEGSEYLDENN